MKTSVLGILLPLTFSCMSRPADALDMRLLQLGNKKVVLLEGEFVDGDSAGFTDAMRRLGGADEVWFDSGGGLVDEGLELGRRIRSLGLATRVPKGATCASICTFAFLGGAIRDVDPGGNIGVHMFSAVGNPELLQAVTEQIKTYGVKGAADVILDVEQYSAKLAKEQADYLIEMSVSLRLLFPNYEMSNRGVHWLTRHELVSYNVVNTGG